MNFIDIINEFRDIAYSKRDLGDKFEKIIKAYLVSDPKYSPLIEKVWMWNEFPYRYEFGIVNDTGIDLVAYTYEGEFWAIQCKMYQKDKIISKNDLDTFLSASSKHFYDSNDEKRTFSSRLFVSTTDKWGVTAEHTIRNQNPPVQRISLFDLQESPIDWEKLRKGLIGRDSRIESYLLKPHQKEVLDKSVEYFNSFDRGKLIMACGTGKTFTSLRLAEKLTDNNGFVLFMVPSIALLGQTLNEWSAQAIFDLKSILICSDPKVNKNSRKTDDDLFTSIVDLALPATTDYETIKRRIKKYRNKENSGLTVVFSTYQSINVVIEVQKQLLEEDNDLYSFDLIVCDEAHRTTGVTIQGEDESYFVKIHNNQFIKANKRLYMTATPRLYSDDSKNKAKENEAVLCSMDDSNIYGEEIYRIGFGEAVEKNLLTDYKVLILTMSENDVSPTIQKMISDENYEIDADDAARLIGSINALSKQVLGDQGIIKNVDPDPMRRAVAFTNTIKNSIKITNSLNDISASYINDLPEDRKRLIVSINSKHIDGSMSALQRHELMSWLKANDNSDLNECKVLTNVRCLSEGVDVPSLDAVMFLSAKNSQVDVVQSVGRVMRKAPNKKYGYIIIPVVIPSEIEAEIALDKNERYKVVWTVLNALRAHDDRFNATINKIDLNKNRPDNILIGRTTLTFDDNGNTVQLDDSQDQGKHIQMQMQFDNIQQVMYAKMVKKVGDRVYWEKWAKDLAVLSEKQISRIRKLIDKDEKYNIAFTKYLTGLRKNINPSINKFEALEMLGQHIITKPVFEALFEDYSFVNNNPVSKALESVLELLDTDVSTEESEIIYKFYQSVKRRADGIDNAEGKQRIIIELYDKFFKTASPKLVEQLGIIYTPVEIVDFMIHSINDLLNREFGVSLTNKNVHVLDPFTGTGTYIARILQTGVIRKEDIEHKYKKELHANEIVLLAYYIAAINIENIYHDLIENHSYVPFEGICLTDTFQLAESNVQTRMELDDMFPKNSKRVDQQRQVPITVILGNPPYSVGQRSANDNAENQNYPDLEERIAKTYAKNSSSTSIKALYDSYIKAFRWASDRIEIKSGGIIAFITNSGYIDKESLRGFRNAICNEFSSIYVVNLRGAVRGKSGDIAKKEGQNVFNIMTGVSIIFLVKKPKSSHCENINYYDIGEYLSRDSKLEFLKSSKSIFSKKIIWDQIKPDKNFDWINQRSKKFSSYIPLAPSKKFELNTKSFFTLNSLGINTNRDVWVYNFSELELKKNIKQTLDFYNSQVFGLRKKRIKNRQLKVKDFMDNDNTKISWSSSLVPKLDRMIELPFENNIRNAMYRPFVIQKLYWGEGLIHRRGQFSEIYPENGMFNRVICVSGKGNRIDFTCIMTEEFSDLNIVPGAQCFPLYYYKNVADKPDLFTYENLDAKYRRVENVSDYIYKLANEIHAPNKISKEDIFYYCYAMLNHSEYKTLFNNDLKKGLPRLPIIEDFSTFKTMIEIGLKLGDLHCNFNQIEIDENLIVVGENSSEYEVKKMKFKNSKDKSTIYYNSKIKISNIPSEAYNFVIAGKSPIEWVMDRYQIKRDNKSKIINNPNSLLNETGNKRFILEHLLKIISLSIKTNDLIRTMPKLSFE